MLGSVEPVLNNIIVIGSPSCQFAYNYQTGSDAPAAPSYFNENVLGAFTGKGTVLSAWSLIHGLLPDTEYTFQLFVGADISNLNDNTNITPKVADVCKFSSVTLMVIPQ